VSGDWCPRTEVTIHQFEPIYRTEIIAIVQCMSFGVVGQMGWWMTFLMVGWGSPMGKGIFWWEELDNAV